MSKIIEKLTEGIIQHDVRREGAAVLKKWEATGLLEGLDTEHERQGMAVLLENQAKQLLKEANTMSGGDVQGFATVAFPIVRRVFGGLLAQKLVSVQPMSLPSGLVFFLDFTRDRDRGPDLEGESIFGQGVVGSQITQGVDIGPGGRSEETGFYNLANGYSSARGAAGLLGAGITAVDPGAGTNLDIRGGLTDAERAALRWDADLLSGEGTVDSAYEAACILDIDVSTGTGNCDAALASSAVNPTTNRRGLDLGGTAQNNIELLPKNSLMTFGFDTRVGDQSLAEVAGVIGSDFRIIRRLTTLTPANAAPADLVGAGDVIQVVVAGAAADITTLLAEVATPTGNLPDVTFAIVDPTQSVAGGRGAMEHLNPAELESSLENPFSTDGMSIPEIDIRVDSVSLTAETKKMKAKWTQELQQDLNAYHNLDAEVELTSVLSEQIALELDQEILHDLITGATAGTRYWSRNPGEFVNRESGVPLAVQPDFTGTVSEWYETLIETVNDVSAQIHRKTLRGGANFLVCGPEVANVLEFTSGFRASVTHDDDTGTVGAVKEGSINKKWDLYVDPYFPRNVILVGRKGSSFLESGYVHAPYVPLQMTPTIFAPEDLTPRKGVMMRYGKRMVRPDMYGLCVVTNLV